jgi:hypothetical protein
MAVVNATKERATARAVKERLTGTIGSMVDSICSIDEQKAELNESLKKLDEQRDQLEEKLVAKMEAEGTSKAAGKTHTVSLSMSEVGTISDWDTFIAYVAKSKNFHLLQRRLSTASWRELFKAKGAIPGTTPFTKKTLRFTAKA